MADRIIDLDLDEEWQEQPKRLLRIEMARRDMGYAELVAALASWGIEDNERNVRNKIARGTFSATFFIQCMAAMGVKALELDENWLPHPSRSRIALSSKRPSRSKR